MTLEQKNLWAQVTTGAGKDVFRLRAMWGDERVSGLFRFDLELESDDDSVDFTKVVGEAGVVSLTLPGKKERHFHGIGRALRMPP